MHKDCPEKENASSQPTCCNDELAEGESALPANYRGCSHAREVLRGKKSRATPKTAARMFTSNFATPAQSFAAALCGKKSSTPSTQHTAERPAKSQAKTPRPNCFGSQCKQSASGQHGQSSFCRTADYDRKFIGPSVIALKANGIGGSATSSVNSCKTYM
jgi:hypothetical protein